MRKRKPLNNVRKNQRVFSRSARKVHRKNMLTGAPMRGGIRL